MEGSNNSDLASDGEIVLLKSGLQPLNMNLPLSSDGDDSSVTSVIEGYESPLSSWDSEPETDILSVINCHGMHEGPLEGINMEESYLAMEQESQFVGVENTDDNLSWEMDNRSYDELLKKFNKNEKELRVSNLKLQISEQEIIKLNVQVENSEGQIDYMREELKLKEEEMHKQKELSEEENFKLKNQVERRENQFGNVQEELNLKEEELQKQIAKFDTQIQVVNEQLKISKDEIASLRKELDAKSFQTHQLQDQLKVAQENLAKSECQVVSGRNQIQFLEDQAVSRRKEIQILEEMVTMYESVKTNHELWMQKVNSMIDSQAKSYLEKDELINKVFCRISEMKTQLTSKLEDCESRNSELENKVMQYEAEKMKQEELNATQQMVLQVEINSLREELGQRKHDVEAANKELDKLMNERDENNAKIDKLQVEICSHDDQTSNMKRYIRELKVRWNELVVDYKTTLNEENKLKLRVGELEKEVTRQNGVISNRDEEKREAIRQLCFTLEYYRSRYLELLQTFVGHRRRGGHNVMAS